VKTNAARILDRLRIPYELLEYEVDLHDLGATKVALQLGLPPESLFKTLVCRGSQHGICLAVVPATAELDLKALGRASADRKVPVVPLAEVEPLTGYVRGGVTALGARKRYPVYLDASALEQARISVSAGVRGTQMLLAPEDYRRATGATVAPIGRPT